MTKAKKQLNKQVTKKTRTKAPVMISKSKAETLSKNYWMQEQLDIHDHVSRIVKKISDPESNIKVPLVTYGETGFINQSDSITTVTVDASLLGSSQKMRAVLVPNFRFPLYITNASLNYTKERFYGIREFPQFGVAMTKLFPPGVSNPGSTLPSFTGSVSPILSVEVPIRTQDSKIMLYPYFDEILDRWMYPLDLTYVAGGTNVLGISAKLLSNTVLPTTTFRATLYDSSYTIIGFLDNNFTVNGQATITFTNAIMDAYSSYDFAFLSLEITRGFTAEITEIEYTVTLPDVNPGSYTFLNGIENESYNDLVNLGVLGNFLGGSVLCKYDGAMQTANGNCALTQVTRGYEKSKIVGQSRSSFDGTAFSYAGITKVPGSFKSSCIEGMYGYYKPENAILDLSYRPLSVDVFDAPTVFFAADFSGTGGAFSLTVASTVRYTTQSQLVSKNFAMCDQMIWSIALSILSATRNVSENPLHKDLIHKVGNLLDKHKDTIAKVGKGVLTALPPLLVALAAL
jgi:hypothetical protein